MRRIIMVLAVAALMAVLLAAMAASAFANCGDGDCSVGAAGEKAADNAQGFRFEGPGAVEGVSATNSGNSDAGQLKVTGARNGALTGTFRDGTARGRGTGVFGDWAGQCELVDFPDEC